MTFLLQPGIKGLSINEQNRNISVSEYFSIEDRSSHQRCSMKKGDLKNFAKFTGKQLCQRFFFNKVAGLRSATLLKKRLWHRCFPVNFAKFLRTAFLQNTSGRLLLLKPFIVNIRRWRPYLPHHAYHTVPLRFWQTSFSILNTF